MLGVGAPTRPHLVNKKDPAELTDESAEQQLDHDRQCKMSRRIRQIPFQVLFTVHFATPDFIRNVPAGNCTRAPLTTRIFLRSGRNTTSRFAAAGAPSDDARRYDAHAPSFFGRPSWHGFRHVALVYKRLAESVVKPFSRRKVS